jgi:hypothetical protein
MNKFKTWLTVENGWVFRNNEFGDEPDWIGTLNELDGSKWFNTYGDNRVLSKAEMLQIIEWLDKM